VDSSGLWYEKMADFCERGNETLQFYKTREIFGLV
jgi:hypothetical protein